MSSPGAMAVKAGKNLTREEVKARHTPAAFFPNARPRVNIAHSPATPYTQLNSPANFFRNDPPSAFNRTPRQLRFEKKQANAAAAAPVGSGVNLALPMNQSNGGNTPVGGKRLRKTRKSRKRHSKKTRGRK